jgi:hypothetical protein
VALTGAGARADEPARSYPPVGGAPWMHGLVADESGTLWSSIGGSLVEMRRGADAHCTHESDVYAAEHLFASGGGAIVIDDGDEIAWRIAGDHQYKRLGRSLGTPVAVWIDPARHPVVVTRSSGVAVWGGAEWTRVALPDPSLSVDVATPGEPGELLLVARPRAGDAGGRPEDERASPRPAGPLRLLRFAAGAITEQQLPGPLPERIAGAEHLLAWYSRDAGTLWIATEDGALAPICLRKACPIAITETRLFGRVRVVTGASLQGGDLVALGAQSTAAIVHRGQVDTVPVPVFPEGLHLAPWDGALYVASRDGFQRVSLPPHLTRGSPPPPSPSPDPCESSRIVEPSPPPDRPAPESPSARPSPESSPAPPSGSQEETGIEDNLPLPSIRLALGPRLTLTPSGASDWGFGLDVLGGFRSVPDPDNDRAAWGYRLYAGYSYDGDLGGGDRGLVGGGVTYGYALGEIELGARLLGGTSSGQSAFGFGETVGVSAGMGMLGIELSHQILFTERGEVNDIGLFVNSEVALLALGLFALGL